MSNNHDDLDDYHDDDDFHEASSSYNDNANDGRSVSSEDSDRDFHDAAELTVRRCIHPNPHILTSYLLLC
jgi:hypothetical protein